MKWLVKIILPIIFTLSYLQVQAQENDTLYIRRNDANIVEYAKFKINVSSNRKMDNDTLFLKEILKTKKEDSFRVLKVKQDSNGYIHKEYQRYYKGMIVEGQSYLIHGVNNNIKVINGNFQLVSIPDIIPYLSEEDALKKALDFIGAKTYFWENPAIEEYLQNQNENISTNYFPKGDLVIARDYLTESDAFKLAWKFSIFSQEPFDKRVIYIDAKSGKIINNFSLIEFSNATLNAQTVYSGYKNITGDLDQGEYTLNENRSGVSISTMDLNHSTNYGAGINFENNNDNWTSGSWASYSDDKYALDAHYAAETTLDFFDDLFERNSINNDGLQVLNYIHYSTDYINAGWDPTDNCMFFGDGASTAHPWTALDTYAHEFAHGINQYEKYLGYGNPTSEAKALNEGFSDIWGACVEYSEAPQKSTWIHGEEVFSSTYSCIRNLENPNDPYTFDGVSPHPDTYEGDYWDENGNAHRNSTVLSHWFYLLSEGDKSTNDNDDAYTVYGIGINNAQRIAYLLETEYLEQTSDFEDAKDLAIDSAEELFGSNSLESMQVANAWYAVGVGSEPEQIYITGESTICPYGGTYEIDGIENLPTNYSISWSSSNNITTTVTDYGKVFAVPSSYNFGWLFATITTQYSSITLDTFYINIEYSPWLYYIVPEYGNYYGYEGNSYSFHAWPEYYSNFTFSIYPPYAYINWVQGAVVNIYFPYPDIPFTISAYANNGTCNSNIVSMQFYVYGMDFFLSPNPASDEVTITISVDKSDTSVDLSKADQVYDVRILDIKGNLKSRKEYFGEKFSIPVQHLKDGEYLIRINNGKSTATKQLIIKH